LHLDELPLDAPSGGHFGKTAAESVAVGGREFLEGIQRELGSRGVKWSNTGMSASHTNHQKVTTAILMSKTAL
jgi:hypothetical protein